MQLEHLTIRRYNYGILEGKLVGEITFIGMNGKVEVTLNDETAQRLLEVVAVQMVQSAKEIAQEMTAEILTHVPALENRS